MTPYRDKSAPKKRQRQQSEREEPSASSSTFQQLHPAHVMTAKRQRIGETKVQRRFRKRVRLNVASREHLQQGDLLTKRNSSITPQPEERKRSYEAGSVSASLPAEPSSKKLRPSVDTAATTPADQDTPLDSTETHIDPVLYWVEESGWPKEYFESNTMSHLLARKRSTPSLRRKRSDSGTRAASSTTPSDQKPREEKSAPYRDTRYETLLATKSSFMGKYKFGLIDTSKVLCQMLLENHQTVPEDSAFRDDLFEQTCEMIRNKNEARVIRDISLLVVPSAEILAARGAESLKILVETVNEGWNNSIPLTGTRPQPDYSVGFNREAFSEEQREKLAPFIGDFLAGDQSYFMATYYMYFPFFTCEVKCGAAALNIADRQNAHSMTLAVRGVVELFRLVKREEEINREILAFSVSHDHESVRIYGHYAVIDGPNTAFYRHPIRRFDFTELEGREKWTAYTFTKNVYVNWVPTHFERLCSAIDDLPSGVNFDVPPLEQDSGLSQDLESHHLSGSFMGSAVQTEGEDSQSGTRATTPDNSFTQQRASKRQRGKRAK